MRLPLFLGAALGAAILFAAPSSSEAQGACEGCNACSPCDQQTTTGYPEYLPITCGDCGPCEQCCVPNWVLRSRDEAGRHISWFGAYRLYITWYEVWEDITCGQGTVTHCSDDFDGVCFGGYDYCCQNWGCYPRQCSPHGPEHQKGASLFATGAGRNSCKLPRALLAARQPKLALARPISAAGGRPAP